jgi:thiamine-monophosphate kinase
MSMNAAILENQMVEQLARAFRRSPEQVNRLNESDAEIIRLWNSATKLAITTDSIVEEIASGLYDDPYMIGWMTAVANFSDLAAVGAAPVGLLIAETLPPDLPEGFLSDLQRGIDDACSACGSYVLGGDTNTGSVLDLTGCALGIIEGQNVISRVGCAPGDLLYSSGLLGSGNAFAISRFVSARARYPYAPCARIREGQIIREFASASMDTSDGTLTTLDQLLRLNNIGFRLDNNWKAALAPAAVDVAARAAIPSWLLLAGQHGEFELLFTVAPEQEQGLLDRADSAHWLPIKLGTVVPQPEISLEIYGTTSRIDTARIRDASFAAHGNVGVYISELMNIDQGLQKGDVRHDKQ